MVSVNSFCFILNPEYHIQVINSKNGTVIKQERPAWENPR